jgi:5-methylcytosine-specific restriction endonuclease McrA
MTHVLLLNATYEPLRVISWQRAIRLLTLGKVEVLEETDREIRSVSFVIRLPSVVRLLRMIRARRQPLKFSRQNIYLRDNFRCQYCGVRVSSQELNLDHVIPRSKGGTSVWENVVCSCHRCNRMKGGRTPAEAGIKLIRPPFRPQWTPFMIEAFSPRRHKEWLPFLSGVDAAYWNTELVQE